MDLKSRDQFDWNQAYTMTPESLVHYMNKYFFVVEREVKPIAMKVWNQLRRCNEVLLTDFNHFNLLMTNKRIRANGKMMTISSIWIASPYRAEYSQLLYWPGPTESRVFNMCTGYQWSLEICEKLYTENSGLIQDYMKYCEKFMSMETLITYLSYLSALVKRPHERLPDFIVVNNGSLRSCECLLWPIFRMFGRNSVATTDSNGLFYYHESLDYQDKKRPPFGKVFVVLKMQQYFSGEIKPNQQFVIENNTADEYHMPERAIGALLYYLLNYPEGPIRPPNSMLYDALILNAETSVIKWWREVLNRGYHCKIEDLIDGNELTCSRFITIEGRKPQEGTDYIDSWIREISQKDLYYRYKKDLFARSENPVFNVQFWERMNEICQIVSERKSKNKFVPIKHRITPTRGKISKQMKGDKRATAVLKYIILPTHQVH